MLTRKQLEVYNAMKEYKARNGVIPSYEELCGMTGIKSKSGIYSLILSLEKRGAIRRMPNMARAIMLMDLP